MKRYTPQEIDALTNWDGMRPKPPFRNDVERRQYYARFINRMLWRYFTPDDWKAVSEIVDELRVDPKLKRTTKFLIDRHTTSD